MTRVTDTPVTPDWAAVLEAAAAAGWTAAVVDAARLDDVRGRVAGVLASGELPGPTAGHLADETSFSWPEQLPRPRSVVVAATPRPLTRATLTVHGEPREVAVPPHYAGYYSVPDGLVTAVGAALAPLGYAAARFEPPLKTLAACAGLARYGRNNISYVPGLGSYLMLAACASDAPPPDDAPWQASRSNWRAASAAAPACAPAPAAPSARSGSCCRPTAA